MILSDQMVFLHHDIPKLQHKINLKLPEQPAETLNANNIQPSKPNATSVGKHCLSKNQTDNQSLKSRGTQLGEGDKQRQERKYKKNIQVGQQKQKCTNRRKKSPQNKMLTRCCKDSKNVGNLQEKYQQLELELKELKQAVYIQMDVMNMMDFSQENLQVSQKAPIVGDQQNNLRHSKDIAQCRLDYSFKDTKRRLTDDHFIEKLRSELNSLFKHQSTIQSANCNYLLLSQVNRQFESQQVLQINNLEERIHQIRFILNSKEDLLAYELVTFQGIEELSEGQKYQKQQPHDDEKDIYIDYNLPNKASLSKQNQMVGEQKFVQKIVAELHKLKTEVSTLDKQLKLHQTQRLKISPYNFKGLTKIGRGDKNKQNSGQISRQQRVFMKKDNQLLHQSGGIIPNRSLGKPKLLNQQVNQCKYTRQIPKLLVQSQDSKTQKNKSPACSQRRPQQAQNYLAPQIGNDPSTNAAFKLTLLPESIHNYKQSLLYRVGKLQADEKSRSRGLQTIHRSLVEEYAKQMKLKKSLIQQYEIKRDIYSYSLKRQHFVSANADVEADINLGNSLAPIQAKKIRSKMTTQAGIQLLNEQKQTQRVLANTKILDKGLNLDGQPVKINSDHYQQNLALTNSRRKTHQTLSRQKKYEKGLTQLGNIRNVISADQKPQTLRESLNYISKAEQYLNENQIQIALSGQKAEQKHISGSPTSIFEISSENDKSRRQYACHQRITTGKPIFNGFADITNHLPESINRRKSRSPFIKQKYCSDNSQSAAEQKQSHQLNCLNGFNQNAYKKEDKAQQSNVLATLQSHDNKKDVQKPQFFEKQNYEKHVSQVAKTYQVISKTTKSANGQSPSKQTIQKSKQGSNQNQKPIYVINTQNKTSSKRSTRRKRNGQDKNNKRQILNKAVTQAFETCQN